MPKIGADGEAEFDADKEWGSEHVLPRVEDSGRWANIPICKPSLMTYVDTDDYTELDNVNLLRDALNGRRIPSNVRLDCDASDSSDA